MVVGGLGNQDRVLVPARSALELRRGSETAIGVVLKKRRPGNMLQAAGFENPEGHCDVVVGRVQTKTASMFVSSNGTLMTVGFLLSSPDCAGLDI